MPNFLANYPGWFVIAAATLAAAAGLWLLLKVLRGLLWVLLAAVVAAGAALTVWALLR